MEVKLFTTLKITDNYTTCDLVDGKNYALKLKSWSPSVTTLKTSTVGNQSVYQDVLEHLTLDIFGQNALEAVEKLTRLLDQATKWGRGEHVPPVYFEVQMQNSKLPAPLRSLIIGRGDDEIIKLPTSYNDLAMISEYEGVQIKFRRRGEWISTGEISISQSAERVALAPLVIPFPQSTSQSGLVDLTLHKLQFKEDNDSVYDNMRPIGFNFNASEQLSLPTEVSELGTSDVVNYEIVNELKRYQVGGGVLLLAPQIISLRASHMEQRSKCFDIAQSGGFKFIESNAELKPNTLAILASSFPDGLLSPSQRVGAVVALSASTASKWRIRLTGRSQAGQDISPAWEYVDLNQRIMAIVLDSIDGSGGISYLEFQAILDADSPDADLQIYFLTCIDLDSASSKILTYEKATNSNGAYLDQFVDFHIWTNPLDGANPTSFNSLAKSAKRIATRTTTGDQWLNIDDFQCCIHWLPNGSSENINEYISDMMSVTASVKRYPTFLTPQ